MGDYLLTVKHVSGFDESSKITEEEVDNYPVMSMLFKMGMRKVYLEFDDNSIMEMRKL